MVPCSRTGPPRRANPGLTQSLVPNTCSTEDFELPDATKVVPGLSFTWPPPSGPCCPLQGHNTDGNRPGGHSSSSASGAIGVASQITESIQFSKWTVQCPVCLMHQSLEFQGLQIGWPAPPGGAWWGQKHTWAAIFVFYFSLFGVVLLNFDSCSEIPLDPHTHHPRREFSGERINRSA